MPRILPRNYGKTKKVVYFFDGLLPRPLPDGFPVVLGAFFKPLDFLLNFSPPLIFHVYGVSFFHVKVRGRANNSRPSPFFQVVFSYYSSKQRKVGGVGCGLLSVLLSESPSPI